ncbi:MAG TPA: HepT-like ribonuclease domain-containing protein [Methanosarcina sp.]|nr:HepT-like ribonuclease domain-containing protein [Methanosarcina sp.]
MLRGAVERYLQVSLECMLDIGEIIISEEKINAPQVIRKYSIPSEKSVFFLKPLPEKLNLLQDSEMCSYIYAKVELDRLYENLQNGVGDMELFIEYIAQFLAKKEN